MSGWDGKEKERAIERALLMFDCEDSRLGRSLSYHVIDTRSGSVGAELALQRDYWIQSSPYAE